MCRKGNVEQAIRMPRGRLADPEGNTHGGGRYVIAGLFQASLGEVDQERHSAPIIDMAGTSATKTE
jgi:hypothetical protein